MMHRWPAWLACVAALVVTDAGYADDGPADESPPAETRPADNQQLAWEVEGFLTGELRLRTADGDADLDLISQLAAVVTGKRLRARINARLNADLAGDQQSNELLFDTWDTFSGDVQVRTYEAYVAATKLFDGVGELIVGRQFVDEGTYFHFDGARLNLELDEVLKHLQASLFGGWSVRFRDDPEEDNWLIGLVLRGAAGTTKTRWRLEYFHVSEFFAGINQTVIDPVQQPVVLPAQHFDDDLVALSIWHKAEQIRVFGRFSLLNGEPNELQLRGRWFTKDGKWTVLVEWYQLFERLFDVTNDLTPFAPSLGSYEPYGRLTGRVTYRTEDWIAQAGLVYRALLDDGVEGQFNHEYVNFYLTATRLDLEDGKLDLSFTVNGYGTSGNRTTAVGGSADYRVLTTLTLSTGVDYSLWKYDWFLDTEHEDVWSVWVRAKWKARKKVTVEGGVSVDDDRFATYATVFVKVIWRF